MLICLVQVLLMNKQCPLGDIHNELALVKPLHGVFCEMIEFKIFQIEGKRYLKQQ